MHGYRQRVLQRELVENLRRFPAVALLGPRQCGKTTLAKEVVKDFEVGHYLDLERPADRRKLANPELYFQTIRASRPGSLICLDEVQRSPEIFPLLRSLIDEEQRAGQFLVLGSASRELIRQSSESLAGRVVFQELTPFLSSEVELETPVDRMRLWFRGGFPRSYLAANDDDSRVWRESFVQTFLERDIPQLGFSIPAETLRRLWRMLAHHHGQILNASQLGAALGLSHTRCRSHIELLSQTFMVRVLAPLEANVKKRLVKSPKVYLRDVGLLHSLLEIDRPEDLLGHPILGASWEGLVIENAVAAWKDWRPAFYRTSNGAELDLVLSRGRRRVAVECKASMSPRVGRGFWNALGDIGADHAFVVAPVAEPFQLREDVEVVPLSVLVQRASSFGP